jgi:LDH2 family malate/lactate/ureidoglycolate dehydrogenase
MMMDIFGRMLTGAAFAGGVHDQYKVLDQSQGVGHFVTVFRPEIFLDSQEEYVQRMDALMDNVRSS